jgi:hypothetical protein
VQDRSKVDDHLETVIDLVSIHHQYWHLFVLVIWLFPVDLLEGYAMVLKDRSNLHARRGWLHLVKANVFKVRLSHVIWEPNWLHVNCAKGWIGGGCFVDNLIAHKNL